MPADITKSTSRFRRSNRKDSASDDSRVNDVGHLREIELKRSRGEISCAECRRLKIKCDKQIPCQSCVRRGCEILCPNDCFTTGQGTRSVIEATGHLYGQINRLTERNRELEDALTTLQAQVSTGPHPLLRQGSNWSSSSTVTHSDDQDQIKEEDQLVARRDDRINTKNTEEQPNELIDSFGTLSISENGVSRFIGPTGGSESLLMADTDSISSRTQNRTSTSTGSSQSPSLPEELLRFSYSFPFTPIGPPHTVLRLIESHLPSWDRAVELCEIYSEGAAWLFHGVSRCQLLDEMLPAIYNKGSQSQKSTSSSEDLEYTGPHGLSLLFIVLAIGALVDLTGGSPPHDPEAEHYKQIASVAICLEPVLEKPSLVTIQAIHLLSVYNAMSPNGKNHGNAARDGEQERDTSMEMTWSLVTLAARLAQSIGLHRDSARWGLCHKMVQRRRFIFWDLFLADAWQSLASGRPPSFSLSYVDCKYPEENDPTKTNETVGEREFETWGYRFAVDCITEVASRTLITTTPTYATVMELDLKVREFPIPACASSMAAFGAPSAESDRLSISESMQRFCLSHIREVVLLYIHRSFFAQAIIEHPEDPLRSPYASSFITAYNASGVILNTIKDQYELLPDLVARFWSVWTYAFSAAIVFGTVVTRGPRSHLAPGAMQELDKALHLFTRAAKLSRRAAKALPVIVKLNEKARNALLPSVERAESLQNGRLWTFKKNAPDDELSIFAGRTRFVSVLGSRSRSPSPIQTDMIPQGSSYCADTPSPGQSREVELSTPTSYNRNLPSATGPPPQAWQYSTSRTGMYNQDYSQSAGPSHYAAQATYDEDPQAYSWSQEPAVHQRCRDQQETSSQMSQVPVLAARTTATAYHHRSMHDEYPPPPAELADLGLASRVSRLDERWTSFMQDSGILDHNSFRAV